MYAPLSPLDHEFWQISNAPETRKRLVEALHYELLGPSEEEEELYESPVTRYLTGLLAPFGTGVLPSEQDVSLALGDGDEDNGGSESAPPISQAMTPSSVGISFLVSDEVDALVVTGGWGQYDRLRADDETLEEEPAGFEEDESPAPDDAESESGRPPKRPRWKRRAQRPEPVPIHLVPGGGLQRVTLFNDDEITLEHLTRRLSGHYAVSVFLVNRRPESKSRRASADRWIFQPTLAVRGLEDAAVFRARDFEPSLGQPDRDLQSNRLLYRNKREFAVGHGCGAEWTVEAAEPMASEVRTTLIPHFELPRIEARPIEGEGVDMAVLASVASGHELRRLLDPLTTGYREWIEAKSRDVASLAADLQPVAGEHLESCAKALERIEKAIDLLETNEDALDAFRFANEAMLLQRSHTIWAGERRKTPDAAPAQPEIKGRWRPFAETQVVSLEAPWGL